MKSSLLHRVLWSLALVFSLLCVSGVHTKRAQLKLTVGKGNSKQRVNLEMTLPQFYDFLAQMEKVRSTMDFVGQP